MTTDQFVENTKRPLPRTLPPPLSGDRIQKHFEAVWQVLYSRAQLAGDLSPTSTGNVREFLVREFLSSHLLETLSVAPGHVLFEGDTGQQIDALIFKRSEFALPLGDIRIVPPEALVACIEVKPTLKREDLVLLC